MESKAYKRAGVDIELGNRFKSSLPGLLASTHRREVLGKAGGFGGLFALNMNRYRQPVLVSSVDGVGTKLKIAFALDRHDTVGRDLVNHCVNDILVLGAEPLFFLDYLATGKLKPRAFEDIIRGFATACAKNGCALIGGETAQMPGFYQAGEYDMSGTIVGAVEKRRIIDGKAVRPGDAVIGLESNGLHTNGYSLARRVFLEQLKWKLKSRVAELGRTLGEELLRVHRSYGPLLLEWVNGSRGKRSSSRPGQLIKGMAHITGGGFQDNIPRVLPSDCDVIIRKGSWEMPPVFRILESKSGVAEAELYRVFNMGIGMVLFVAPERADGIRRRARKRGCRAWIVGEVTEGSGRVKLV